jgi:hypothetical protein
MNERHTCWLPGSERSTHRYRARKGERDLNCERDGRNWPRSAGSAIDR